MVRFYQKFLSKYTPRCIYVPSCSEYCILAVKKYGVRKGLKKAWERINRCDMAHIHNYGMEDYP
jgi:putative membrane protein insertion efficiency factor